MRLAPSARLGDKHLKLTHHSFLRVILKIKHSLGVASAKRVCLCRIRELSQISIVAWFNSGAGILWPF
jgi:hypothetical protein